MKLIFAPVSIVFGLLSGMVGKKVFDAVWGLIDEEEPPTGAQRRVPWGKLLAAAALQGAIFRIIRQVVDRGLRGGFASITGTWPGEQRPDAK